MLQKQAMCALCASDHTLNYKGYPKYKKLLKHRKFTYTIRRTPNNVLTFIILKPSPHSPKAFYSSVADPKNTPFLNHSINDHIFFKFISEFSSLIYFLISLLTVILHNQINSLIIYIISHYQLCHIYRQLFLFIFISPLFI